MEEAYAFNRRLFDYPVEECGEPVGSLPEAAREAGVEVVFSETPHVNGLPRLFWLREGLIPAWLAAAREMNERGWVMRVEDAYRTLEMQKHLARQEYTFDVVVRMLRWELGGADPPLDLLVRRLAALIAPAPKVGTHMSASAVDLSVVDRDSGEEVDRGGPYVLISEATPMDSPFISPQAQANRQKLTALMRRHGFVAYPWEFWHYSAGDAFAEHLANTCRPARYGPVHVNPADGRVTPVEHPRAPLNSPEELAESCGPGSRDKSRACS